MAKSLVKFGNVKFEWFVDRALVTSRVDKKVLSILKAVGQVGRKTMRNSIRPPRSEARARKLTGKKSAARFVSVDGREYAVPVRGRVIDVTTGRPARQSQARAARLALRGTLRSEGAGLPPRRGPNDLLRQFIFYGVDPNTENVVIGAMPFRKQPRFSGGIVSVPQLLDQGGGEYIGNELVKYQPRPFVNTALDVSRKTMAELLEKTPL